MLQSDLFEHIEMSFKSQKPFVAYRKPKEALVKAMFQKNSELFHVNDFSESGFVFAPFDSQQHSILFPLEICEVASSQVSFAEDVQKLPLTAYASSSKKANHILLVKKGIDEISNGRLQKVVLSRMESVPISEDNPVQMFKSLLKIYATAFVYIWYHPKIGLWLGATPETLLQVEGLRFKTVSLAGTQTYDDLNNVEWNQKNIEEQQFVTDYIETELKPFVQNIAITPSQTVRAGQLLHLKSEISGVLKPYSLQYVLDRLHPTPAVCGIPFALAKTFIVNNEPYNREYYTGFLGELNLKVAHTRNTNKRNVENNAYSTLKNTSHFFVNLRCMQLKDNNALVYVGGGITQDSNPNEEWEETVNKAQTMLRVLRSE